jgi:hypothetical protein
MTLVKLIYEAQIAYLPFFPPYTNPLPSLLSGPTCPMPLLSISQPLCLQNNLQQQLPSTFP